MEESTVKDDKFLLHRLHVKMSQYQNVIRLSLQMLYNCQERLLHQYQKIIRMFSMLHQCHKKMRMLFELATPMSGYNREAIEHVTLVWIHSENVV